jgi:hypothetical protein
MTEPEWLIQEKEKVLGRIRPNAAAKNAIKIEFLRCPGILIL